MKKMITTTPSQAWKSYYSKNVPKFIASPGNQLLLRLLKGNYVNGLPLDYTGFKVIDVGCGFGFNLITCGLLGMDLYGCDLDMTIIDKANLVLQREGFNAKLRVGQMEDIPFDDDQFDILIAWNVIHYAGDEVSVKRVLGEFRRVLRVGGRLWLMTTGPNSYLYEGAYEGAIVEGNKYFIRGKDFRKGMQTYCFENEKQLSSMLETYFHNVKVGRSYENLFGRIEDHYFSTALFSDVI